MSVNASYDRELLAAFTAVVSASQILPLRFEMQSIVSLSRISLSRSKPLLQCLPTCLLDCTLGCLPFRVSHGSCPYDDIHGYRINIAMLFA